MKLNRISRTLFSTIGLALTAGLLAVQSAPAATPADSASKSAASANPSTQPVHWTPVMLQTSQPPSLFRGSEGKYNLVYEILVFNYNPHPSKLTQFDVLDDKGTLIKSWTGKELAAIFVPIVGTVENELPPGCIGVVYVNLAFDKPEQAPKQLKHRINCESANPLGQHQNYPAEGAPLTVDNQKPLVIGPPLQGGRWIVSGGYSGKLGHRRAFLPINNNWRLAQRYAIDWLLLNDKNYSCQGDTNSNASYPGYGQPVVAVADGTISGIVEKFLDQPPGKAVGPDRISFPGGNSLVQDLGNGHFAFYAHLKPDSVKVKEGEKVKRGQKLAELGNTGNSTGPHLHFHIQDGPKILESNGTPYVFDTFLVTGQFSNLEQFEKNDRAGKPQVIDRAPDEGTHKEELPKEGTVLSFPQ